MVSSGAQTLDLHAGNLPFFLCAMLDYDNILNFDNVIKRPACSGSKKALTRGGGGKIGGTRLELGIAGREKNAFLCIVQYLLNKTGFCS
jgi:hypothetical protein